MSACVPWSGRSGGSWPTGGSSRYRIVASAVVPGLFAPEMQPDAVWAAKPVPAVHDPQLTAAVIAAAIGVAAEKFGDRAGVRPLCRGEIALRTISEFSKRRSVGTPIAVGQVAIFRSCARHFGDASKFIKLCRFHRRSDASTDRNLRVGSRGDLDRAIGRPGILEASTFVSPRRSARG